MGEVSCIRCVTVCRVSGRQWSTMLFIFRYLFIFELYPFMILYFPLTVLSMLNGSVLLTFIIIPFVYHFVCLILSFYLSISFLFLSVVRDGNNSINTLQSFWYQNIAWSKSQSSFSLAALLLSQFLFASVYNIRAFVVYFVIFKFLLTWSELTFVSSGVHKFKLHLKFDFLLHFDICWAFSVSISPSRFVDLALLLY